MSIVKKIKDILFEEEEYTEQVKVVPEPRKEEPIKQERPQPVIQERPIERTPRMPETINEVKSERELFAESNAFNFPDFDEDEFISSFNKNENNSNVLDFEKRLTEETKFEKRSENKSRFEKVETKEFGDKKRFKPSPIISPVYGILNQDYKAEDIIKKEIDASNIDIVRKKAFEKKEEPISIKKEEPIEVPKHIPKEEPVVIKDEPKEEILIQDNEEPVVTFIDEEETLQTKEKPKNNSEYKSIDELLETASNEIPLEETLEMPATNNLDAIEEELEKLDNEVKEEKEKDLDEALESDLYELIDSMYEEREGE